MLVIFFQILAIVSLSFFVAKKLQYANLTVSSVYKNTYIGKPRQYITSLVFEIFKSIPELLTNFVSYKN